MSVRSAPAINEITYARCVKAFSFLHDKLAMNLRVHAADHKLEDGQIFLFNHFARIETVIPQYIIYQATKGFCRCVAAPELFAGNGAFAKFLWSVGAVPTNHPGLLPFLTAEIFRGRKVIVFPEGGMIKDRNVIDNEGEFGIYSPMDQVHRKLHKGAAAIALTLEIVKKRILLAQEAENIPRLQRWVDALGLDSIETLITAAKIPTLIIPGNITFYPIRNDENFISKGVGLFCGKISRAAKEELSIEGNILFKKTDMDVRFGQPIAAGISWNWWDRVVLDRVFQRINNLHDMFALKSSSGRWVDRMISKVLGQQTGILRDEYTREIYSNITVNLGHIASRMIMTLLDRGTNEIDHEDFRTLIYISVKYAQRESSVYLHQDLESPEIFEGLHKGVWKRFEQFLVMAASSGLIEITSDKFRFLPKLKLKQDFHEVRLENAISVCANEMAPVTAACQAVDKAVQLKMTAKKTELARFLFDDEIRSFKLCRETYFKPCHAGINEQETATESGEPFFLVPENARKTGVVLVHGFLASPAELRAYGEKLAALGYPVIGVRLCGHGTSPWDLHGRTWRDWLESVRRGADIMSAFADRICLVGFSTGGALALLLAAEQPKNIAGVVAISTPVKFRDRRLVFVPLIHGINKLINWVSPLDGVMPFSPNDAEHPEINYKHIPLRGVFELRRMVKNMKRRLGDVSCPVSVIQGDEDQVIDPKSADIIVDKIGSAEISLHMIPTNRHGILNEDIGGTQELVTSFLASLSPEKEDSVSGKKRAPMDRILSIISGAA